MSDGGAPGKKAEATLETLHKIFTVPESEHSTLHRLDREISENLLGFLGSRIVAGDIAPANLEQDFLDTRIPEEPLFVSEQVEFLLKKVVAQSVHTSVAQLHRAHDLGAAVLHVPAGQDHDDAQPERREDRDLARPSRRSSARWSACCTGWSTRQSDDFYARWTQSFTHSLGVFCSGGTLANITALWVARNRLLGPRPGTLPGWPRRAWRRPCATPGSTDLAVLVSRRGHYSLRKAADLLGLGQRQLISIPVTAAAHHRPAARCAREIAALRAQAHRRAGDRRHRRHHRDRQRRSAGGAGRHRRRARRALPRRRRLGRAHPVLRAPSPPARRHRARRLGHARRPQAAVRAGRRGHGACSRTCRRCPRSSTTPTTSSARARATSASTRWKARARAWPCWCTPRCASSAGAATSCLIDLGIDKAQRVRGDDPRARPTSSW